MSFCPFGTSFLLRREVLIISAMTEPHGKHKTVKHGSQAAWRMYIVSEVFFHIRAVKNLHPLRSKDFAGNCTMTKTVAGMRDLLQMAPFFQTSSAMHMRLLFLLHPPVYLQESIRQMHFFRMHWLFMINTSGMKQRDFPVIHGIQNLQSLMITVD